MQYYAFPYLFQSSRLFGTLVILKNTQINFSNDPKDHKRHENEWNCMNVTYPLSFIMDPCELDCTFVNVCLICEFLKNKQTYQSTDIWLGIQGSKKQIILLSGTSKSCGRQVNKIGPVDFLYVSGQRQAASQPATAASTGSGYGLI